MIAASGLWHRFLGWGRRWLGNWRSHAITVLAIAAVAIGVNAWQTRDVPTGKVAVGVPARVVKDVD